MDDFPRKLVTFLDGEIAHCNAREANYSTLAAEIQRERAAFRQVRAYVIGYHGESVADPSWIQAMNEKRGRVAAGR